MENLEENIIQETKDSSDKPKGVGFEMSQSGETGGVVENLDSLARAVDRDKPVTGDNLIKLDTSLQGMKISIAGVDMTVEEAQKIPDFQMNVEIWKEIREGKLDNYYKLTILPDHIAEHLSRHKEYLNLDKLTFLSDKAAECLSKHRNILRLEGLTTLSDQAAEHLSKHEGSLILGLGN